MNFINPLTSRWRFRWQEEAEKLRNGEITKDEYDKQRYDYPKAEVEAYKTGNRCTPFPAGY